MGMGVSGAKILALTSNNTSFSKEQPGLQLAWDSTSMGTFKECPWKYYLVNICGYQVKYTRIALEFGIRYHSCLEKYEKALARGETKKAALRLIVRYAMENFGYRVKGEFKNYISKDTARTRETLVRAVVWYVISHEDDNLQVIQLKNGKPAVELSFRLPFGDYTLCGHIDRMVRMKGTGDVFVMDLKTTKTTLGDYFYKGFSPDNQMSFYSLAGKIIWNEHVAGMMVEACQTAVTFTRFGRGFATRPDAVLEEWTEDLQDWISLAKLYATRRRWPQNDKSCHNYGGCEFREFCGKVPTLRTAFMETNFNRRIWDPLVPR